MRDDKVIELGEERSLHAVTDGWGPDVVLMHGALTTSHDWLTAAFRALVAEGLRVTAIDRPGQGKSRRPRFEGTPRDQARQIRDGLERIGVGRMVLAAHSFGCAVALAYAELFPEDVAELVLVAPLAFPEPRPLEHGLLAPRSVPLLGPIASAIAEATFDLPLLKLIQRRMFAPQPVPDDWERSFPYDHILDSRAMVFQGEDAAAMLPLAPAGMIDVTAIRTPGTVLIGTADRIVEHERQGRLLARLMTNARLCEADGVGHMLHHVRPELVVQAVKEAVARAR